MTILFEWDDRKDLSNQQKHGISFEEAKTIFEDENALLIHDPDHSDDKDRFVLLGMSESLRILVVCHCYRKGDEVVRINLRQEGHQQRGKGLLGKAGTMRKEYDFSKTEKNPYAGKLKRPVTIRMEESTVRYFKELAQESGIPYQTLINLYLRECAATHKKLKMEWKQ